MLMFPEGSPDMQTLLQQAAAMQQQLLAAQEELTNARVEGSSGGGLVTATVSGTGDLINLTIAAQVCDPDDPETLADLVLAAVADAANNAQRMAAENMADLTGGSGAETPDLGKLGF
jgi:DNA-binding YbaB/EbfC family protein